jgi:hypothetical protein
MPELPVPKIGMSAYNPEYNQKQSDIEKLHQNLTMPLFLIAVYE